MIYRCYDQLPSNQKEQISKTIIQIRQNSLLIRKKASAFEQKQRNAGYVADILGGQMKQMPEITDLPPKLNFPFVKDGGF